ncbi:MAG: 50S ribosomal protein L35 [Dehalococcoidia bacterium]|nr:50S ribosomal protein L35 [Dehalococcoidia bacterium]MSQ34789.1 50S ribosomal protein L35 [Dehalococcoidia bacterium]
MPKIKTHSGAKRRFHITAGGKVLRTKGPKSHLRRRKSDRVKSKLAGKVGVSKSFARRIKALMPYA